MTTKSKSKNKSGIKAVKVPKTRKYGYNWYEIHIDGGFTGYAFRVTSPDRALEMFDEVAEELVKCN